MSEVQQEQGDQVATPASEPDTGATPNEPTTPAEDPTPETQPDEDGA